MPEPIYQVYLVVANATGVSRDLTTVAFVDYAPPRRGPKELRFVDFDRELGLVRGTLTIRRGDERDVESTFVRTPSGDVLSFRSCECDVPIVINFNGHGGEVFYVATANATGTMPWEPVEIKDWAPPVHIVGQVFCP